MGGGGAGGLLPGGGVSPGGLVGWFGGGGPGGAIWGAHAPKAKRSITRSPYLPVPSL